MDLTNFKYIEKNDDYEGVLIISSSKTRKYLATITANKIVFTKSTKISEKEQEEIEAVCAEYQSR